MGKFISPRAALIRVVEDDEAPTRLRIEALEQIPHPPLCDAALTLRRRRRALRRSLRN